VAINATSGASLQATFATGDGPTVRIKNVSATNTAFVAIGTAGVRATVPTTGTAGGFPIGIGETVGVTRNPYVDSTISVITGADVATVYATTGDGV
jgi:hypothetical protein